MGSWVGEGCGIPGRVRWVNRQLGRGGIWGKWGRLCE